MFIRLLLFKGVPKNYFRTGNGGSKGEMSAAKWSIFILLPAAVILCSGWTDRTSNQDEMRQFSCSLDNNWVAFNLRKTSELGTVGAHTYGVDFQEHGPTIRLPPTYYAPDWKDVEEIAFQYLGSGKTEGRLSLRLRDSSGPDYTQQIGIVQRACWEAAKGYLQSRGIKRPIREMGSTSN
jgi:hypothetical protein